MQRFSGNRLLLVVPAALMLVAGLFGQLRSHLPVTDDATRLKSYASPSWLDPQRFTMNHGFSISLISGSGLPGATSLGVYTNQMRYLVTQNLLLSSQVHVVQPGFTGASMQGSNPLQVYYQAGLDWRLSDKFNIHVGLSNLPARRSYAPWYRPVYSPYAFYRTENLLDRTDP